MGRIQAVILAAGQGKRLGNSAQDNPKCLVEIGGRPLIKHQLEALADHGVGPVLVVLGHKADAVREVTGEGVEYVSNSRYEATNSLYSLWLAREWVEGPFLLLNSDLLFHPDILDRLLAQPGNALAYDSTSTTAGREQTKVAIKDGQVLDLGKDVPADASRGENLGLIKFDGEGAFALIQIADALVQQGHEGTWVTEAVRVACSTMAIQPVNVAGLPWVEVDFPFDLDRARREVWPAIEKSQSKVALMWRRTRWAVAGFAALTLVAGGWLSSSSIGPASIDWESVTPASGVRTSLTRAKGTQQWWMVDRGDSVMAEFETSGPIRLEFRSLLPLGSDVPGRYVVQVVVDGQPYDWRVFKATPDSSVGLPGFVVGDRDRIELALTPGRHRLAITLLAGTGEKLLSRVRRPE